MNLTTQLADALRAVSGAPGNPCNCLEGDMHGDCGHCVAREALAAYDAQQRLIAAGGSAPDMPEVPRRREAADKSPPLPEPVSSIALAAWGPKPDYFTEDQLRERDAMWLARLAALTDGAEPVGEFVGYGRVTGEPHVRMKEGLAAGSLLYTAPRPSAALVEKYELRERNFGRLLDDENAWARGSYQQIQDFLTDLRALSAVSATPGDPDEGRTCLEIEPRRAVCIECNSGNPSRCLWLATPAPAESLEAVQFWHIPGTTMVCTDREKRMALVQDANEYTVALRAVSGGREECRAAIVGWWNCQCPPCRDYAKKNTLTTPAAPALPDGEWYCPSCRCNVPPVEVTYSEHHEVCGASVGTQPQGVVGDEMVERACVAFFGGEQEWLRWNSSHPNDGPADRRAMRKALTAALHPPTREEKKAPE